MNLNDRVRVQVTERGKKILSERGLDCDEQGYHKTQLWELMAMFGKYMHIGFHELIFTNNEVVKE